MEEDKTKEKLKRARRALRKLKKSITEPPKDKMVKEPEIKKSIWNSLAQRGYDLHSGDK